MRAKMGLLESRPDDETLVQELLSLLQGSRVDYTRFFRELGEFSTLTQPSPLKGEEKGEGGRHSLRDWFLDPARFDGGRHVTAIGCGTNAVATKSAGRG